MVDFVEVRMTESTQVKRENTLIDTIVVSAYP